MATYCCSYRWLQGGLLGPYYADLYSWCTVRPCHSVIALGGQFTWNWSNVAVNRVLLNAACAVWSPVFFTHHRPHHVSGVRGPENGSLFFRWIAYVIYSGSCLIPLRRSPSATAIICTALEATNTHDDICFTYSYTFVARGQKWIYAESNFISYNQLIESSNYLGLGHDHWTCNVLTCLCKPKLWSTGFHRIKI